MPRISPKTSVDPAGGSLGVTDVGADTGRSRKTRRDVVGIAKPGAFVVGGSHVRSRAGGAGVVDLLAGQRVARGTLVPEGDLAAVEARVEEIRRLPGVVVETLGNVAGHDISAVHLGCSDPAQPPRLRVLITAGVHGNENVGPGAAVALLDQLLTRLSLRQGVSVTVVPCLNPTGFVLGTRENADGIDLNRRCLDGDGAPLEVRILRRLLDREDFDLAVDLHSAGGRCYGFFALHLDSQTLLEEAMVRLARRFPVEGDDDGPYHYQAPGVFVSDNRGTLKDATKAAGAKWSVTVEAPRALPYPEQVAGTAALVKELIAGAKKSMV